MNLPQKNLPALFFFCFLLMLCLLLVPGKTQAQENGAMLDKIIAKVDNYIVLHSELEAFFLDLVYKNQIKGTEDEKCKLLEQLVIQKLMLAKAEIDSVVVDDKEVSSQLDRRIDYLLRSFGGDERMVEKQYGKTLPEIKSELFDQIKEQLIVQKMEQTITEDVSITPKEVKKFFESIPKDSLPYINSEVEVAHIVNIPDFSKEQKRVVKEKLEKIREKIMAGESFEEMAKLYSEDYASAKLGGDTEWQTRGTFAPEYEATVFKLKPGEVSKIIETQFGFHIIKLIERRGNEFHSAHILLRPDNNIVIDNSISEKYLDSIRTRIQMDSLTFAKAAKENSDDLMTKDNGGRLFNPNTRESLIAMDELDSYLFFVLDTMKVGTISKPLPYRTEDGKSAYRIIYFISKTQPHTASLEVDYHKIHTFALNNKKNQAINEWFRKTKDQVYINLDKNYLTCKILEND